MTSIEAETDTARAAELASGGRGAAVDKGFRGLALATGLLVLVILAGIVLATTNKAWPVFNSQGLGYLTGERFDPGSGDFGIRAYLYGTIVVSLIAIVFAVPVSVGIALFTTELAPKRWRFWITTVIDLLAAVPSVVFGLWGLAVVAPKLRGVYNDIHDLVDPIPGLRTVFGTSSAGRGFMTAGIIVALMITPIITSITREVVLTVPRNDKDGALALGATRWEMITSVVLPHSMGGIVGAVMLGLGRAMGETIAIVLLIGGNAQIVANLFGEGEAMPSVIARQLPEASGDFAAALIGVGVVLFIVTVSVNVAAKLLVERIDLRLKGAAV